MRLFYLVRNLTFFLVYVKFFYYTTKFSWNFSIWRFLRYLLNLCISLLPLLSFCLVPLTYRPALPLVCTSSSYSHNDTLTRNSHCSVLYSPLHQKGKLSLLFWGSRAYVLNLFSDYIHDSASCKSCLASLHSHPMPYGKSPRTCLS